ncbi:MAG: branched-chain amino acid ABC transporter permease [Actinobacteria bacterium]|nr:branched-chain amino acid ABC transporter permease [Actinomycetota bacterium]
MPTSFEIFQALASGLLLGGVYAILGVGFGLCWGVMKVINLSHSTFALLAVYIAYWMNVSLKIDPLVSLFVSTPLFFVCGIVIYRLLIGPLAKRAEELVAASMVLTFGLAILMENAMQWAWKPDPRVLNVSYTGKAFFISRVSIPYTAVIGFAIALVTTSCIYLFLKKTYLGMAVRAVWQNKEGAALCGVNIDRVSSITFGISLATAAAAGVCLSLIFSFNPSSHLGWLIYIFLVVIFGGVGSIPGVLLAGLLIGLITNISAVFIPNAWVNMILFGILATVLLLRPTGLLGQREAR